jgi:SAM-dependent methyltransferase
MRDFARRYASGRRYRGLLRLGFRLRSRLVRRHLWTGARILDVGAADGGMLDDLHRKLTFTLAVSMERNLELAAAIPRNGVCGSGVALPFRSEAFDLVVCSATRKHIPDSLTLTKEAARVLRRGGRLIVVDPHPWVLRVGRLVGKFDPRYLFHLSYSADLAREMDRAGLLVELCHDGLFVTCVGRKDGAETQGNKDRRIM